MPRKNEIPIVSTALNFGAGATQIFLEASVRGPLAMSNTIDAEPYDCQPIATERAAEAERDYGPLMTAARRAALDALERELGEFLRACQH
jgi:hypothetical protein